MHYKTRTGPWMEPIEGSETSTFKTQTPWKYTKVNILHKEHGESLKLSNQSFSSNFCMLATVISFPGSNYVSTRLYIEIPILEGRGW